MDPRYRISPESREYRERMRTAIQEWERLWEQGLSRIEYYDDLDERHLAQGQSVRSAHNAQKRGVKRLFDLVFDTTEEVYGHTDLMQIYRKIWDAKIDELYTRSIPVQAERVVRIAGNRQDVKDNYLYQEWKDQVGKKNGIRTYPVYALYVALKAAIAFISTRSHRADILITFFDPETERSLRESVLAFKESKDYQPNDPACLIGHASLIPGLLSLAETILMRYGDFVRAERGELDKLGNPVVDSPLPDDPYGETLKDRYEIPEEIRFENGYQAYLAKEGSAKAIAKKYDLPRDRFFEYLRERGIQLRHGGDRKATK